MVERARLAIATIVMLASASAAAAVAREDIIVLAADGQHFTSYKTLRSDLDQRVLYMGPDESPDDALFIVPSDYTATPLSDGGTSLRFNGGSFAIMEAGRFGADVSRADNGDLVFTSWNGETRADGHLGKWNSPGDFDSFAYSWVVPDNIDIRSYNANRPGQWTERGNTLSWHGEQVNDIAFTIRYHKTNARQPQQGRHTAPASRSKPKAQSRAVSPADEKPAAAARRPAKVDLKVADMAAIPLRNAPAASIDGPAGAQTKPAAKPASERQQPDRAGVLLNDVVMLSQGRPLITANGHIVLDRLARRIITSDATVIKIIGPAVNRPRDTGASAAKAASVADYLSAHGVDAGKIISGPGNNKGEIGSQQIRVTIQPAGVLAGFKPGV